MSEANSTNTRNRRLSFEGSAKLDLSDLPKPSFKTAPAGQRSVPALDRPGLFSPSDADAPLSGTLTPGAAGHLGLGRDPWNLFASETGGPQWNEAQTQISDSARPVGSLARSTSYTGDVVTRKTPGDSQKPVNPGLRRADTQRERHSSSLAILNSTAEDSPLLQAQTLEDMAPATKVSSTTTSSSTSSSTGQTESSSKEGTHNTKASSAYDLSSTLRDLAISEPSSSATNGQYQPQQLHAAQSHPHSQQQQRNYGHAQTPLWTDQPNANAFTTNYFSSGPFNPLGGYGSQGAADHTANGQNQNLAWPLSSDPTQQASSQVRNGVRTPSYQYSSGLMSRASSGSYGLPPPRSQLHQADPNGWNQIQHQQPYFNVFHGSNQRLPGAGGLPLRQTSAAFNMPDYSAYGGGASYPTGMVGNYAGSSSQGMDYSGGMLGALRYEDRARGMRSPLLEEFRANRHRRWDLCDIIGHIVEFSGDQLGSRHLQTKLDSATVEEKRLFFDEMMPDVLTLSTDLFSNYVVQKAFEIADHNQKLALVKSLEGSVLQLSLQMYGCRVVQKALECVLVDEQVSIVSELKGSVLKCARDQNANHVLQRVLERVPADRIKFIPEACEGQVYALATHPYGCRVLQRILENTSDVRPLIDELLKYTQNLMQDQYSNYVIQHLLERGTKTDRTAIIACVRGQLVHLSKHKFASNVIDKVILCADEDERRSLIDEILFDPNAVMTMLRDQFANYCLQKFMLVIQNPQRDALMARVADSLNQIRKFSGGNYSKHLLAIEKYIANEQALAEYNRAAAVAMGAQPLALSPTKNLPF